jgi:DNA-binding NarL/FixJ family response regulator
MVRSGLRGRKHAGSCKPIPFASDDWEDAVMAAQLLEPCGAGASAQANAGDCLNERELAVAIAVAGGRDLDEVATWFDAPAETMRGHLRAACRKLAVGSMVELEVLLAPFAC